MATLTGNKIKDSYLGLLKSISNGAISSSFVQISDGGGNALPLYLSTSSIKFYNAYTFPSADGTVSGQVLSTDASGTLSWVTSSDNQTLQEVLTQGNTTDLEITTTAQFNGDINGALLQKVIAAEALSKGDVVYISGGTGANPEVSKAKADSSTTMPALGIMKEPLSLNAEGECITSGELTGVDLTGIATGAELFVSSATAGELVTTAPTGEANLIQKIGKVIKGDSSGGALTVLGAFRTNAVPNLNSAKIFLGNASNQAVSTAISGDATISDTGVISLATVPVTKGGTGATTLTGILLGNGTSAISGITSAVDGNVLTADGNGGYAFEGLPVKKTGTITVDELAVFDNADGTLRSDSTISIDSSGNITFDQGTNNYLIGGGNIAGNVGSGNVGLGHNVLTSQTSGNNNIAIGFGVLDAFVTGASNIALGDNSMGASTGGTRNIAIGKNALQNGAGSYNLAIGDSSMSSGNLSGLQNTCVGYTSGNSLTSGGNNLFIGNGAGSSVTTVSNNVILGSNNGSTITDNNNIIISDGGGNNRIQVDSGGNVGVGGTPSTWSTLTGLQVKNASLAGFGNSLYLTQNTFYDGTAWKYIANDFASKIQADQGMTFSVASSGIAPNAITWIDALTISSGGNVGIGTGTATPSQKLEVRKDDGVGSGLHGITDFNRAGGVDAQLLIGYYANGTSVTESTIYSANNMPLSLATGGSPRLTISSGGVSTFQLSALTNPSGVDANTGVIVKNNGWSGITLLSSAATGSFLTFGDADAGFRGRILYLHGSTDAMVFETAASEKLRISSGGDVNIGTADGLPLMHGSVAANASYCTYSFVNDPDTGMIRTGADTLALVTAGSPRLTISSVGDVTIGSANDPYIYMVSSGGNGYNSRFRMYGYADGGTYGGGFKIDTRDSSNVFNNALAISSTRAATFSGSVTADGGMVINGNAGLTANNYGSGKNSSFLSSHASQPQGILIHYTAASPNGTGNLFIECKDTSTQRFTVRSNGGVANYSGNNVNLASDIRLKKDIVNLPSEWDRLKQIKVVNYRYKDSDEERVLYGAIAQQVQEIYPNLVEVTVEATKTKPEYFGLREQPFQWLTTKVLQEAMTKIESQQTIIEDLKARIEKLEG